MSNMFRYLTHPQVNQDPKVPVPRWGLSDIGKARLLALKNTRELINTRLVISSTETKAIETAEVISELFGAAHIARENMHENDRSATGYLPPQEFEQTADAFFLKPHESVRGWETAIDAQERVFEAFQAITKEHADGDLLFVGHGGVGTLLLCRLLNLPIARLHDQPAGGGNYFVGQLENHQVSQRWQPVEKMR